jgi:hypothetical protein
MAISRDQVREVEGQWDELVRHPGQFAGQRVRVTVLSDQNFTGDSLPEEISRWLAEGDAIKITPPTRPKSDAFGDALVEKFRKQGLVL